MVGRWASAASIFTNSLNTKFFYKILLPYLAFGLFLGITAISGNNVTPFYSYAFVIPVLIIADVLSKDDPAKQLLLFSSLGIISLIIGMLTSGLVSVFAFISVGLFCSTLWPCIFTLATNGLGSQTTQGSSLLIMMIMGGAVISILQGVLADIPFIGIKYSYLLGVICFGYLAYYALRMKKVQREV
jgi:FHS family L-fucose permease-like MFS transporter